MDTQWEDSREYCEYVYKTQSLNKCSDLNEYMELINDDRYTVFISGKHDVTNSLTESNICALQRLGLNADLKDKVYYGYIVVIDDDNLLEICEMGMLQETGVLSDGFTKYSVISAGGLLGDCSSITIDGIEYSINQRGINIVVYDKYLHAVVDRVCFDTCSGDAVYR